MTRAADRPPALLRAYVVILAVLIAAVGLIIAGGGVWLLLLGGSFYYLIAGLGLLATAWFLFRGEMTALWIYVVTFVFTLVWALWERGLAGWAQVPRLVGPAIVLALVLLAVPTLRRMDKRGARRGMRGAVVASAVVVAAGLAGLAQPLLQPPAVFAQAAPSVEPDPSAAPGTEPATPATPTAPATELETGADWPAYGGTYHATRYSPLDQITPANVRDLKQIWEFRTGDMPEDDEGYSPENTPLKIGDTLFVCSAMGIVIGVDAATGREEWRFDPGVADDAIPYGATCRGVAYYQVPDISADAQCAARIIWGTLDARLIAVDAVTGQPCADFGSNGEVNLEEGIGDTVPGWYAVTSAPTIVRGIAVIGAQVRDGQAEDAPSGVVRGYDASTGALVWAWDLGNPSITTLPPEGEVYTRGTPNMWTTASGDEALGHVYLPLGNSSVDYYGSNRSERENEYATSLVAVDVTTGRDVWHFRTVNNDIWDYDLGGQGSLVDLTVDGQTVPVIVLPTKQGDIYVLDRRTGEPLFPVEQRATPRGGVEPEYLAETQPFSTYHTLAKRDLTEADMWGATPIDQLWCRIQFRMAAYDGIYTPPTTDRHWIQYPGYNGGSDWGGIAIDPQRGIIVANYNDMPNHNRLLTRDEADERGLAPINAPGGPSDQGGVQVGAPYAIEVNAGWRVKWTGLLCKEPPYGGIRAIELSTGRTLWDKPFGTARKNGPFGIPSMLPLDIGTPNNGGAVLTASGLIFIAAATDDLFRAIDIATGETVWQTTLPAGGQSNPFTFEVDGKQFVGLMTGGHHFMETPIGDQVIAWALP
ncbi:MAG: membrane-bound PQQ-dependent dehydrogenase, glucose/quinate/shikimate family [Hyphomicrobiales bacterium]|nr:MAG: membrane-bound PQQ-dependent dehydrogenase, glucose/quinate/shikimate family [Hyphomicrobiales bacterium]